MKTNGQMLGHVEPLDVNKLEKDLKEGYKKWDEECSGFSLDSLGICHQDLTTGKWNHDNLDCRTNWADPLHGGDGPYCPVANREYCEQKFQNLKGLRMMRLCFDHPELAQEQRTLGMRYDKDLIMRYSYVSTTH